MKFLITGSYTADGAKGLLKEGGSGRKAAVQKALEGLGGKLEALYYTFGKNDVVLICDVPDVASGLALSIVANSSGTVNIHSSPLISVEEVDAACKKSVGFRAAGR